MISGKTCLVGLLGQPVNHSLSPVIHNAAMKEMDLDWCYLAMPCEAKNLKTISKALLQINCQGLNITIPHKQEAMNICEHISPLAKKLGAVNTLVPNQKGGWNGMNTDVEGFLAPLQNEKWLKRKAIILGCGGSARAVIAGLQKLNFSQITVIARKETALKKFLIDFKSNIAESEENSTYLKGLQINNQEIPQAIEEADLIVNTTPVGMSAKNTTSTKPKEIPLGEKIWEHLKPKTTLYDLIYTPKPTSWLTLGAENGCKQINGLEMLIQQGAASLRLWSKNDQIPIDVMREAAKQHLNA